MPYNTLANFEKALRSRGLDPLTGNAIVTAPVSSPTPTAGGSSSNPFSGLVSALDDALKGFNINPPPQSGQGAYGKVPGPIAYPTTPYDEATRIYPGLANLTPQVGEQIRSQVAGEFTPEEENALWDVANRFGVASGMPGSQLWSNKFMGNVIGARQQRIQQGVQNYQTLLNELSKMGVDPQLAAEIAARNANMGAAPDPRAAAEEMLRLFRESLAGMAGNRTGFQSPAGGGGGFYNPAMGTRQTSGGSGAGGTAGFPFWPQGGTTPNPNAVATTSFGTDLYGLGQVPVGTAYDPYTDSSIYSPWMQDWSNMFSGGGGQQPSGYLPPGGDQSGGGDIYGLGDTPFGTSYNPYTDQSTYNPFAGTEYDWFSGGTEVDPWEEYFFNLGY